MIYVSEMEGSDGSDVEKMKRSEEKEEGVGGLYSLDISRNR